MISTLQHQATAAISQSYALLCTEQDLSPCNCRVTESLTHLVRTLTKCQSTELTKFLLSTEELVAERAGLPNLCGAAECEMEKYWSRKLSSCANCNLEEFWYFPEYMELCDAELKLFRQHRFDRISFLGAGALPITAFLLAHHCPKSKIICVDYDAEAVDLSCNLTRRIGLKDRVEINHMDAKQYSPGDNELVICASLLDGREEIYNNVTRRNNALMVRDSEGAYQFLYRAAELPSHSFRQIAKTARDPKRINTSRYYEWEMPDAAA